MKKTRLCALILIVCTIFSLWAPAASADVDIPSVSATSVVVADLNSDQILYSKNMDSKAAPASLTKIMTILVAVEKIEAGAFSLDDMVEAQADCRNGMDTDSSTSNIYPGEIMSLKDLLYCAMLQSANEACNIIAAYMAGSVIEYVRWMNDRALELGCTGTSFVNTNGLTDINHYTTAYDLSLITREAMKHQLFATMCNTVSYDTAATNVNEPRSLKSSNALICSESIYGDQYLFKGACGVKTGHTNAAGFCLVSTAQKDGVGILCIVLGSEGSFETGIYGNFEDSISLYKWAFANYAYSIVRSTSDIITRVDVELAKDEEPVSLRPECDIRLLLPKDYDEPRLVMNTIIYDKLLVAPIPAGTVLGETEVFIDGISYGSYKLINNADVELSRTELMKRQFKEIVSSVWFKLIVIVFAVVIAGYFLLVARYRKLRQKHIREKQLAEQKRRQAWEQRYAQSPRARGSVYGDYNDAYSRERESGGRPRTHSRDYEEQSNSAVRSANHRNEERYSGGHSRAATSGGSHSVGSHSRSNSGRAAQRSSYSDRETGGTAGRERSRYEDYYGDYTGGGGYDTDEGSSYNSYRDEL